MKTTVSTKAFLNKFEASAHLYSLYLDFLTAKGITDNIRPDFYSILTENLRTHLSPSALAKGLRRGNRGGYGLIDHIKLVKRPYYDKAILLTWFNSVYAPSISKTLH